MSKENKENKESNGCGKKHLLLALAILAMMSFVVDRIVRAGVFNIEENVKEVKENQKEYMKRILVLEKNDAGNSERFKYILEYLKRIDNKGRFRKEE